MLCLSGFELYSRWVPLDKQYYKKVELSRFHLCVLSFWISSTGSTTSINVHLNECDVIFSLRKKMKVLSVTHCPTQQT